MLLEVLRKIWVWLYVRKIVRLWEVYGALTPSQHGTRKEHDTDSALMVHINCFEHAKSTNTPLFLSSWDIRRAFDPGGEGGNGRQLAPPGSSRCDCQLDCTPGRPRPDSRQISVGVGSLEECRISGVRPGYFHRCTPGYLRAQMGHPPEGRLKPSRLDGLLRHRTASTRDDPSLHFQMSTVRDASATVCDLGYADDLVSLSSSLAGLEHKAALM